MADGEENVDEAVEEAMTKIDEHRFATPGVSPVASYNFYVGLAEACALRADAIRDEHGIEVDDEGENGEDDEDEDESEETDPE